MCGILQLQVIIPHILGKMSKGLKKLMKKIVASDANEQLAVADAKLGSVIKSKTDLDCVYSSNVMELMRCIRSQMPELVSGGDEKVKSVDVMGHQKWCIIGKSEQAPIFLINNFRVLGNDCNVSWPCSLSFTLQAKI